MKTVTPRPRPTLTATALPASRRANRRDGSRGAVLRLKRILVPVDFSGCSKKAIHYAAALAQDYSATIVLVHVIDERQASDGERNTREAALSALAREEVPGSVAVSTLVKTGEALREITSLAETAAVDLLVISTHALTGLPDFCLGSAAEQIVRYARCPVLVVREQEHDCLRECPPAHALPRGKGKNLRRS